LAAGGELEGKVNARQLAAGGDAGQRPGRLSRIGSEEEDDLIETVAAKVDLLARTVRVGDVQRASGSPPALQGHGEAGAGEPEVLELAFDALHQGLAPGFAGSGEGEGRLAVLTQCGGDLGGQLVAALIVA